MHSSEEEEEGLIPLVIVAAPIIGGLVAADAAFNEGNAATYITKEVIDPVAKEAAGHFLEVINPLIADLFTIIGEIIVSALGLGLQAVDAIAKDIINGGLSRFGDIVTKAMGSSFNDIKNEWGNVDTYISAIKEKENLDLVGASDFIASIFESRRYVRKVEDQVISSDQDELITIVNKNGNYGYISSKDKELLSGTCSLNELKQKLEQGRPFELMTQIKNDLRSFRDSIYDGVGQASSSELEDIMDLIKTLVEIQDSGFKCFLETFADNMGSIQFIVDGEAEFIVGAVFEVGVSVDVEQLLYLAANGSWQQSTTKIASLHVGWAIDCGAQGGGDLGFSIAYHTSRVTGVRKWCYVC